MRQRFRRNGSGERRAVPLKERVIRFGNGTLLMRWSSLLCHISVCFCIRGGWGQPKLTSSQSSVDGISELSHQRQSAVSCCSTRSPTLCTFVLRTSDTAAVCALCISRHISKSAATCLSARHDPQRPSSDLTGRQPLSDITWRLSRETPL